MEKSLCLRSRRVVFPDGIRPASIHVRGEIITRIGTWEEGTPNGNVGDFGDEVISPGVVDTHAHINEPGRTEWEGFETATRAARAGGITTIIDMPLNSIPPTTTVAALELKERHARGHCAIDFGFWGGVIPGNRDALEPMVRAGAKGFKCFLIDSGVAEFPAAGLKELDEALPILARLGVPLLVHAELESAAPEIPAGSRRYADYLQSRPRKWENDAIAMMISLAKKHRARVHIVHLSSSDALPALAAAKREGVAITAETCPHYLTLEAESIPDGATAYKCAPPIREHDNREALWRGLLDGTIDFVVSDHSPCTPALKKLDTGEFGAAWGGIASLQLGLSLLWTEARRRGLGPDFLARCLSERTAAFAGLARKGVIAPGRDADFVAWNPDAKWTVDAKALLHRHPVTPYAGREVWGRVTEVFLRGSTGGEGRKV